MHGFLGIFNIKIHLPLCAFVLECLTYKVLIASGVFKKNIILTCMSEGRFSNICNSNCRKKNNAFQCKRLHGPASY